jgi:predicted glycogen debranching enzyme
MIEFGKEICGDLKESATREWLETNGIGGFASSTIAGINTRRYHGLLVAAATPPTGRAVLLSKLEETIVVNDTRFELSANRYPNAVHPAGYKFITNFRLDPFPVWTYRIEDVEIEKMIFMVHGENTTVVEYKFQVPSSKFQVQLELRPLIAFRDYHHLRRETNNFDTTFEATNNLVSLHPRMDLPEVFLSFENAEIEKTGFWYRDFVYDIERERGFDYQENLFQPLVLKFQISDSKLQNGDGQTVSLIASTEIRAAKDAADFRQKEIERRQELIEIAGFKDEFRQTLVRAADQFIVKRGTGKTIIAGYHWFSDWGRDTMIALPGLTLTTNRAEIAKSILREFSRYISEGMLPNRFPDAGENPDYNTVDATLWYFEAIRAYLEKTDDYKFVQADLYEKLVEIIVWHLRGTRFNIHVDTDGLLCAGDEDTQLTWMDAKFGETVFTPRYGKPVEIQALWYNALRVMEHLAEKFADKAGQAQYKAMAEMAQMSFNQVFWNKEEECLYDCINGERDPSVRPNQIFAVSLYHSMLPPDKAQKVVKKVEAELLTPVGLRSLSPKDAKYRPIYEGNGFERDSAYHQGTVWGWLAGAFYESYAKVFADEPDTPEKLKNWLEGYQKHLTDAGIGQISEIFDGDAPHNPRGCVAQAWSIAEVLRAATEILPKTAKS